MRSPGRARRTTIVCSATRVVVEGVQRLAQLPHHVVGHVDQVVDRAQAHRAQPLGEPGRRRACTVSPVMTRAQKRGQRSGAVDLDARRASPRPVSPSFTATCGKRNGRAGERGHLARHAHHRERVGPVRRDLDLEDRVVEAEVASTRSAPSGASAGSSRMPARARRRCPAPARSRACPRRRRRGSSPPSIARPPGSVAPGGAKAVRSPGARVGRAADHRELPVGQRDAARGGCGGRARSPSSRSMASISPTTTPDSPSTTGATDGDLDARVDEAVGDLARARRSVSTNSRSQR